MAVNPILGFLFYMSQPLPFYIVMSTRQVDCLHLISKFSIQGNSLLISILFGQFLLWRLSNSFDFELLTLPWKCFLLNILILRVCFLSLKKKKKLYLRWFQFSDFFFFPFLFSNKRARGNRWLRLSLRWTSPPSPRPLLLLSRSVPFLLVLLLLLHRSGGPISQTGPLPATAAISLAISPPGVLQGQRLLRRLPPSRLLRSEKLQLLFLSCFLNKFYFIFVAYFSYIFAYFLFSV